MSGRALLLGLTFGWAVANASPATGQQVRCADLAKLSLPEATVTAAQEVPAGEYAPPAGPRLGNLPAFCRVALTVSPQIHIERGCRRTAGMAATGAKAAEDTRAKSPSAVWRRASRLATPQPVLTPAIPRPPAARSLSIRTVR